MLFFILSLFATAQSVKALTDGDKTAIANAPDGLLINQYFKKADRTSDDFSDKIYPYQENYAKVDDSGKVLILADGYNKDYKKEVKTGSLNLITAGTISNISSYGAIWSDVNANNYIDTKETDPQEVSAWLYFGKNSNDDTNNGQGMALVIQNDPKGIKAVGAGQQGLGVYGFDDSIVKDMIIGKDSEIVKPVQVASTAVQNSVAIEFDTQQNKLTLANPINLVDALGAQHHQTLNGFDTTGGTLQVPSGYPENARVGMGGAFGHIALTYPARPDTYALSTAMGNTENANKFYPFTSGYTMMHTHGSEEADLITEDVGSDRMYWHHMTMKWTKSDEDSDVAQIDFSFNDKNPDGTDNYNKVSSKGNVRVDFTANVNLSTFGTISNNRLLWGFTGANSSNQSVESKLVNFESIPALVNIEPRVRIIDNTLSKTITDDPDDPEYSRDNVVNSGDSLTIKYDLEFMSGHETWHDILADIELPTNFDIDQENVGQIEFSNGAIEQITLADLKNDTNIQHAIGQELSKDNRVMNVSINGTAVNKTEKDVTVASAVARFTSENNITTVSTPEFIVRYQKDWKLGMVTPEDINIIYQQDSEQLILENTLQYSNDHEFESSDPITYEIKIKDKTYQAVANVDPQASDKTRAVTTIPIRETVKDADGTDHFWEIFGPANTTVPITVTAMDKYEMTSDPIVYYIHVLPDKSLKVEATSGIDFGSINANNEEKLLNRKNDFSLVVRSYNSPWKLYAKSTNLTNENGNEDFNGNVIFVDPDDDETYNLVNNLTFIDQDNEVVASEKVAELAENWEQDDGVLLHKTGLNTQGKYSGYVTWSLNDTP